MKKKIESLKGKKSPCWVKVKFNGIDEYVYGIAHYDKNEKKWFIFQSLKNGSAPIIQVTSGLMYSWGIFKGDRRSIISESVSELYILPKKPRTQEFKNITLKYKIAEKIELNKHYEAAVLKGFIRVGCQTIPNEVVRNLSKMLID